VRLPASTGDGTGHQTGHQTGQRLVDSITRDAGLLVDAEMTVSAPRTSVPEEVVDAFVGAARESLRNIARHAGVDRGHVTVRVQRNRVEVEVRDQGTGLAGAGAPGYGIRESIVRRMTQVGGSAEVGPGSRGAGTLVRLGWPASPGTHDEQIGRAYDLTLASSGGVGIVQTVAYPMLVAQLVVAVQVSVTASDSWVTPAVVVALVVATVLATQRVTREAPTLATLSGWGVAMALLAGAGLWAAGPGAVAGFESFAIGFSTLPLILFAYVTPARYAPVLIVPLFLVLVLVVVLDTTASAQQALGCFNAAVTIPAVGAAMGALVRRSTARIEEQRARAVRAEQETLRAHYLERARSQYLRHTQERILPWLEAVAAGEADSTSAEARERARLLGAEARDDLYAPAFFDEELRREVTDYRRRGGEVVVRAGVAPGAAGRTSGQVLRHLVRVLPPSHRITVSAPSGTDQLRLVVVPALPADVHTQTVRLHPGIEATGDEFATVLRLPDVPLNGDVVAASREV
jgi:hypothetical protein